MRILVVSDSHFRLENLISAFEKERPDVVMCAGDCVKDIEELSCIYPKAQYHIVFGNCDYFNFKYQESLILEIEGIKFFLSHGHLYNVKATYSVIERVAKEEMCDIVIFGHTHTPCLVKTENITLFNPGAIKDGNYGVIEFVDRTEIEFFHKSL